MDDAEFDPYSIRNVEAPISDWQAFFFLIKCCIGTGILAFPWAFTLTGFILGTLLTMLCTVLLIYGINLLITCMLEASRRHKVGYVTFRDAMVYAFTVGPSCCTCCAKTSGYVVDFTLALSQYGIALVYLVFTAINFKQFADQYIKNLDLRIWIAIFGLLCLPLFLIRQLKYLSPVNILATFILFCGLIGLFAYFLRGLPPLGERDLFVDDFKDIPVFMGIVIFATSSVGVFLLVESKMATPQNYIGTFGVLNFGGLSIVLVNVTFGIFGYWRYGESALASVTLNIPQTEVLAHIIKLAIAIAVFLTFPLAGYVTVDIIINRCVTNKTLKHPHAVEYVIRVLFVLVCTLNGIAFPNFGPLLSLVGAFALSLLNLIFPCVMELCMFYKVSYGRLKWKLWKDIIIIIIGLLILGYGSYRAIDDIVDAYVRI